MNVVNWRGYTIFPASSNTEGVESFDWIISLKADPGEGEGDSIKLFREKRGEVAEEKGKKREHGHRRSFSIGDNVRRRGTNCRVLLIPEKGTERKKRDAKQKKSGLFEW